jgi:hypothetical protein
MLLLCRVRHKKKKKMEQQPYVTLVASFNYQSRSDLEPVAWWRPHPGIEYDE